MYMGFLSGRTFNGFCTSYFRSCVRQRFRNVYQAEDRAARRKARMGLGPNRFKPETARQLVARVTEEVRTKGAALNWDIATVERIAYERAVIALIKKAQYMGYAPDYYLSKCYGLVIEDGKGPDALPQLVEKGWWGRLWHRVKRAVLARRESE
jgi:hypothetical protein